MTKVVRTDRWSLCGALGLVLLSFFALTGCGSTKSRTATEQLLMSDAVDRAIAQIDFSDLAGQKVFFDTKFLVNTKDPMFLGNQKGLGFVNAEYIMSSLRQQMVAADLRLQDKIEEADFVVEARLGAVGVDNNEVVYGIPASAPISTAASTMLNGYPIPSIPEISVARKNIQLGAAKVGVFAYDRRTRQPVWQAGISQAMSDARDSWVLGVGPFQRGTIYKGGTRFAGGSFDVPGLSKLPPIDGSDDVPIEANVPQGEHDPLTAYSEEQHFRKPSSFPKTDGAVQPASAQQPAAAAPSGAAPATPAATPAPAPAPATTPAEPKPIGTPAAAPVPNSTPAPAPAAPPAPPAPSPNAGAPK